MSLCSFEVTYTSIPHHRTDAPVGAETVKYIRGSLTDRRHTQSASARRLVEMATEADSLFERVDSDTIVKVHLRLVSPHFTKVQVNEALVKFLGPPTPGVSVVTISHEHLLEMVVLLGVRARLADIWARVRRLAMEHIFRCDVYDRLPLPCRTRRSCPVLTESQDIAAMVSVVDADWPLLEP